MSDDLSKRGPSDRERVNIHEAWERAWWCRKFGCSEVELSAAVHAVGVMADDVERHLKKR